MAWPHECHQRSQGGQALRGHRCQRVLLEPDRASQSLTHERAVRAGRFTLEDAFLAESEEAGLLNLKGHRSVGGMRASLYNAVPEAAVEALVDFMADFEKRRG